MIACTVKYYIASVVALLRLGRLLCARHFILRRADSFMVTCVLAIRWLGKIGCVRDFIIRRARARPMASTIQRVIHCLVFREASLICVGSNEKIKKDAGEVYQVASTIRSGDSYFSIS